MVFPHLRRETTSDTRDEVGFETHFKLSIALVKSTHFVSLRTHSNLQITLFVLQQQIESNNKLGTLNNYFCTRFYKLGH